MKANHTLTSLFSALLILSLVPISLTADDVARTAISEIGQYNEQLVEVTAIPLVSTFKEDEGYGVWNLLIGENENKLLCYEDGTNIENLRQTHEDIQLIIDKNEDFKNEGADLQTIRVRGFYDGESEILNLTEIIYLKADTEYHVETDPPDEPVEAVDDQESDEYQRPIEKYIIYHEVGRPWLYAPAWYHYPVWWGYVWVDVHWWWRPWYDCDLRWYRDRYCHHWDSRYHNPYGYYDEGKPYRQYDRRRGTPKSQGDRYADKQYRYEKNDPRQTYPSKEYRAPRKEYTTDRYRGVKPRRTTYTKTDRIFRPTQKSYRTGSKYSRPTVKSRPTTIRSQPSRSTFRSSPSPSRTSRGHVSRPSATRSGRRR